VFHISILGDL